MGGARRSGRRNSLRYSLQGQNSASAIGVVLGPTHWIGTSRQLQVRRLSLLLRHHLRYHDIATTLKRYSQTHLFRRDAGGLASDEKVGNRTKSTLIKAQWIGTHRVNYTVLPRIGAIAVDSRAHARGLFLRYS